MAASNYNAAALDDAEGHDPMWLDDANTQLGWPARTDVTDPKGGAPNYYARLVREKIGNTLTRKFALSDLTAGVLSADPSADSSEAPLAVVLQFSKNVEERVVREAQRLCWNFSRTALLITLEPTRVQAWTCALAPKTNRQVQHLVLSKVEVGAGESASRVLQSDAAQTLHWVNLVSGGFLREHPLKFRKNERADAMLVANLRAVRKQLLDAHLDRDICHSLLARLIFTQFLFHRTDSEGRPAISQSMLDNRCDGYLTGDYTHGTALERILQDKEEAYALFRWLNEKFNGDLFPGKGATPTEREAEWQDEKDNVTSDHLRVLSDFVSGRLILKSHQRSLWPLYSFDTLPLEFISSVYEEFLNEDQLELSAYYTPPHLVDFVLDSVLPWGGTQWDLHILDPCCGSGIFLVKAFQRLVQRWRNAHPSEEPGVEELRGLVQNNLFGVDDSEDAIRVASFSLCLALCDAIDPKHYWKRALFPRLRDSRLIKSDFFVEDRPEFQSKFENEERTWDLVIGNAPWRGGALADNSHAMLWASNHDWPVADGNPGPLFLAKAIKVAKLSGHVSMIQPAATLLYQRSWEPSDQLRRKLFLTCTVEEVVSFAHLRWQLFKDAKSPACLVTLKPIPAVSGAHFSYICPKPLFTAEDDTVISIERQDTHEISVDEAVEDPIIWTILLLGQRRDVTLVRRLREQPTLGKLKAEKKELAKKGQVLLAREGIIRGRSKQRDEQKILNRKILEERTLPHPNSLILDADALPTNKNSKVHHRDSTDFNAFELPQMLVKQSILKGVGRFQAQLVRAEKEQRGVICSQSYVSVHQFAGGDGWLRSACLTYRSSLSAYFLILTSRLAFDRAEALASHVLDVPVPEPDASLLSDDIDPNVVDELVEDALGLRKPERVLISDLLEFGYRDGAGTAAGRPGREPTVRSDIEEQDDAHEYANFFLSTLRSTFGSDRAVRGTVFEEISSGGRLPVRMVAIHLDWPQRKRLIMKEKVESMRLRRELAEFYVQHFGLKTREGTPITSGLGFQRVARLFITQNAPNGIKVPTVLIVKPDQRRYWARSQALRDADELASSIITNAQRRRGER